MLFYYNCKILIAFAVISRQIFPGPAGKPYSFRTKRQGIYGPYMDLSSEILQVDLRTSRGAGQGPEYTPLLLPLSVLSCSPSIPLYVCTTMYYIYNTLLLIFLRILYIVYTHIYILILKITISTEYI
jgi:hypothetical protein